MELLEKVKELRGEGATLQGISSLLNISLSQCKKLSSLGNFLDKAQEGLSEQSYTKLKDLELKALVLTPMQDDIEGLEEILAGIDINIKRDDLALMPVAYTEKKKALEITLRNIKYKQDYLVNQEDNINKSIRETEDLIKLLEEKVSFIKDVKKVRYKKILLDYIGLHKDSLVLKRRLHESCQRYLKSKGILKYDEGQHVWIITDIDAFKAYVIKRLDAKKSIELDIAEYNMKSQWGSISNDLYRTPESLDKNDYVTQINNLQAKIDGLQKQHKEIAKELKQAKKMNAKDYVDSVKISDALSEKDIKQHMMLQAAACKYFFNKGYICATEIAMGKYRFDGVGYLPEGKIVIIEAKASREDFRRDDKLLNYLEYCNGMYLVVSKDANFLYEIEREYRYKDIGILLMDKGNRITIHREAKFTENPKWYAFEELRVAINVANCKKVLFGF